MNSDERAEKNLGNETALRVEEKEGLETASRPLHEDASTHPMWLPRSPPSPTLTLLVGERQREGGLLQGALWRGPVVDPPLWRLPVQIGSGQVAELPSGVGGAPAFVPTNAAASIQAGDLAEIYNIDLKVTWWKNTAAPTMWPLGDNREAGGARPPNLDGFGNRAPPEMQGLSRKPGRMKEDG